MDRSPTEAVERDADAFLDRMRQAVGSFGPARARTFACMIARRHLDDLGEDDVEPRAMVEAAHALAAAQPVSRAKLEAWLAILREVSANVDPDRLRAPDVWRALGVVQLALRACTEGPPAGAGPFDVLCGALAARALCSPPADEAERQSLREALRTKWDWKAVQEEARWIAAQVEERGLPLPAVANAPSTPAASGAPRVFALSLEGHELQFIGVDGNRRFAVVVNGRRCRVRERLVSIQVSEGGSSTGPAQPAWEEAATADLTHLLRVLAAGQQPKQERGCTVVRWHQPGAHFRQNDWTTVEIALAPDGVVELETRLESQDDSYY